MMTLSVLRVLALVASSLSSTFTNHESILIKNVRGWRNTLIRKATTEDLSRIAEILVFVKRMKYRSIFHNDGYSFGNLQVISVAEEYSDSEILNKIWVHESDDIVKGLIHVENKEIAELYVDYFFQRQGIGSELIEFAKREYGVSFLWTLEKNQDAIAFYEAHGFKRTGERQLEKGTTEYIVKMKNDMERDGEV